MSVLPDLVTIAQVAECLHCDRSTVDKYIDDGLFEVYQLPNSNRKYIKASSVAKWFEGPKKRKVSSRALQAELQRARARRGFVPRAERDRLARERKSGSSANQNDREALQHPQSATGQERAGQTCGEVDKGSARPGGA
jgi:hypothetical protein